MIVVDAAAWVDYLVGKLADGLVLMLENDFPVSPPHVDFEVGSALCRMERHGRVEPGAASFFITQMSTLPFDRVRHPEDAVAALSMMNNARYADAWYLATATRLDAPVMTTDSGMIEAARIHNVQVVANTAQDA